MTASPKVVTIACIERDVTCLIGRVSYAYHINEAKALQIGNTMATRFSICKHMQHVKLTNHSAAYKTSLTSTARCYIIQ